MDAHQDDSPTSRVLRGQRVLALAVALALPLLSACGPDEGAGFPALSSEAGQVQVLVGAPAAGSEGSGPLGAALDAPQGVVVHDGVRYVADTGHGRVLRIASAGTCVVAGASLGGGDLSWCGHAGPTPEMQHPTALAVDQIGDLFVADPTAHRVFVVSALTSRATPVAGSGADGAPQDGAPALESPLRAPSGLAVDDAGTRLYVADARAGQVLVVDTSGVATPPEAYYLTPTTLPSSPVLTPSLPVVTPPSSTTSTAPAPVGTSTPTPPSSSPAGPAAPGVPTLTAVPTAAQTADPGSSLTAAPDPDLVAAQRRSAAVQRAVVTEALPTDAPSPTSSGTPTASPSTIPTTAPSQDGDEDEDDAAPVSAPTSPSATTSASAAATAGRLFVLAGTGCAPAQAAQRPVPGASGSALDAALSTPTALALASGQLLVGDPGAHRVSAVQLTALGTAGSLTTLSVDDPSLQEPVGLAVTSTGDVQRVVAVDAATHSVVQAPLTAAPLRWSTVTSELTAPNAVSADRSAVLVADSDADAVVGVTLPAIPAQPQPSATPSSVPGATATTAPSQGSTALASDPSTGGSSLALVTRAAADDDASATGPRAARSCATTPAPVTPTPSSSSSSAGGSSGSGSSGGSGGSVGGDPVVTPAGSASSTRPKVAPQVAVPGAGAHRMAGADRVETAVTTSQQLFSRDRSAPAVVISSSTSAADATSGARLAAELGGPLLLTPGDALDASVAAEVRRVLASGGSVVITGGEKAVSPGVAASLEALAPGNVERVGGADRYASAVAMATRTSTAAGASGTAPIFLVTGTDYPDALVVVALARRTGGVVVLSQGSTLPAVTRTYLEANDPTGVRTVPVGGPAAAAAATLGGTAGRTASAAAVVGTDRYDTARKVAERFEALDALEGASVSTVGLATGTDWPDALTGSSAMATLVGPLLLNHGTSLDPAVAQALAGLTSGGRPTTTLVFGGDRAVPASAASAFGLAAGLR